MYSNKGSVDSYHSVCKVFKPFFLNNLMYCRLFVIKLDVLVCFWYSNLTIVWVNFLVPKYNNSKKCAGLNS